MKAFLRTIQLPWIISLGSAVLGIIVLAVFLPHEGEMRNEGITFSIGYLGFPATLIGSWLLMLLPASWDPHDIIGAVTIAVCYFTQWQLIAWLSHRWLKVSDFTRHVV